MKVAVTGAAGHVGGNLVRALLKEGREVRALLHEDRRAIQNLPVEIAHVNILDPASVRAALKNVDVVYHLAARISVSGDDGGLVQKINMNGTRNVVEGCLSEGVRRLVHFSSIHAFNQCPSKVPLDESRPLVDGGGWVLPYDLAKARGERIVSEAVGRGLDAVIVNPTAILGPNDFKPSAMGEVLLMLFRETMPALVAGGFDWVDVRDVVSGAMAAEKKGGKGEKYLLSGQWLSFADLAKTVKETVGVDVPRFVSPIWLAKLGAPFSCFLARYRKRRPLYTVKSLRVLCESNRCISHEKASKELGYQPRPIAETIRDSYRWFQEAGMLPRSDTEKAGQA
jgi:dihydroflavonol-4-reductase